MKKKSILLTTYHEAFLHKGGGEYELLETALNLRKLGFIAEVYSPFSRDIEAYDVILHFSIQPSGLSVLEEAKKAGKNIILWPNFWFGEQGNDEIIHLGQRHLDLADAILFKSQTEKNFFEALMPLKDLKTLLVPAGVDPCFSTPTPKRLFRDSFGLKDYVLWIGIFEPCKNQLTAIEALRDLSVPVVFIGNYREASYYEACRKAAPEHFLFLDSMPHKSDLIRAAIQECRLYIEPTLEPAGKSVIEAAISGAKVLLSNSDWAKEHFNGNAIFVNPVDKHSILEGTLKGLEIPRNPEITRSLIQRHALPHVLRPLCDCIGEFY